jgi:hypothetical protein
VLANSIDEVVDSLDEVIRWTREAENRLGYFAALYRKVTAEVRKDIHAGGFDDGPRMERLDVVFANRYLAALDRHRRGDAPTESWQVAFAVAKRWWPIVLQHLLLGMNAHINLDLGVAAATVAPGDQIHGLQRDFDRINGILARLGDESQRELAEVWPALELLDKVAGRTDDAVINFSIEKARRCAWRRAVELAPLGPGQRQARIERLDREVAAFAAVIVRPGPISSAVTRVIRLRERGSVPEIIDLLS